MNIAKDATVTVRLTQELKVAIQKEAARRNVKTSDFLETAIKRELRRTVDNHNLSDLLDIQDYVQKIIDAYTDVSSEVEELPSVEDYVQKVYDVQSERGYVLDGFVHRCAHAVGMSYNDFLRYIDGDLVDIVK